MPHHDDGAEPGTRLHGDLRALASARVTLLITWYLVSLNGVGQIAFFLAGAGGSLAFVLGPPLRRPQHAGPRRWLMAAGVHSSPACPCAWGWWALQVSWAIPSLWSVSGYVRSVAFDDRLLRRTGPAYDATLWLDLVLRPRAQAAQHLVARDSD